MAVHKCYIILIIPIKSIIDLICTYTNCHCHITVCKPFGNAHYIWTYSCMVHCKHLSCSSKTCSYLICNQKHVIQVTKFPKFPKIQWRIDFHSCTALNQRLDYHSTGFMTIFCKCLLCMFKAFTVTAFPIFIVWASVTIWCLHLNCINHDRFKYFGIFIQRTNR